jgi:hypothetical protein
MDIGIHVVRDRFLKAKVIRRAIHNSRKNKSTTEDISKILLTLITSNASVIVKIPIRK